MGEELAALLLAVACYAVSLWIFRRAGRSLLALPIVVTLLLVLLSLAVLGHDASAFVHRARGLGYLMEVAVVAMALPLHAQLRRFAAQWRSLAAGLAAACGVSAGGVLVWAWATAASWQLALAFAPKAATMPVALSLVPGDPGSQALAVSAVFMTGVVGTMLAPGLLRWSGIQGEHILAFTLGATAHAIGVAGAQARYPQWQSLAVLGMCGNALATALLATAWRAWAP